MSINQPGNLHLNITSAKPSEELLGLIEPFVYEFTASHRGSISAEHGLGLMKSHAIVCLMSMTFFFVGELFLIPSSNPTVLLEECNECEPNEANEG